jgi:transcriptional regulator with XRE-family HTH domain
MISSQLASKLSDSEYRRSFVASQINVGIPFQIRALMKERGWTQAQLAERAEMLQPRISGLMTPGKTRPNIDTLRRLAEAFDCALMVRFLPFSELAEWSENFDPETFRVPDFRAEMASAQHGRAVVSGLQSYLTGKALSHSLATDLRAPTDLWQHFSIKYHPSGLTPQTMARASTAAGATKPESMAELTPAPVEVEIIGQNPTAVGGVDPSSVSPIIGRVIPIDRGNRIVRRRRDPRSAQGRLMNRRAHHA